jgi:hypothetical protein
MVGLRGRWGRWQTWVTLGSILIVVLVVADIVLVEQNRALQAQINARGQFIQQSVQLEALSREMVNAIANLAVQRNDDALRTLLTQHGIMVSAPADAGSRSAAPAAPAGQASPRR